jgi:hypothetical protein
MYCMNKIRFILLYFLLLIAGHLRPCTIDGVDLVDKLRLDGIQNTDC